MSPETATFPELVCALSSRLAGASGERVAQEVVAALEAIRARFGADQCGIMRIVNERGAMVLVHRVAVDGVPAAPTTIEYTKHFPAVARSHAGPHPHPYVLDRLEDLSEDDAVQLESSRALELGAYVGIPIVVGGEVRYSLAIACNNRSQAWPREQIPLMQVLGETIANALEREKDEARVRQSESDLAHAQRVARTGSWVRDFIADHFSASEEAYRIMGARPASAEQWKACIHAEDRARVEAALADILRDRRTHYEIEYRVIHPDGDVRVIADSGEVRFDADGRPLRAIGTIRDLTDSRRTESELRELRGRIGHADRVARAGVLGGSLSHELNQPLAAILANAQAGLRFLQGGNADPQEIRRILEAVVRDDKRAIGIIDGLHAMLRRREAPREAVDLAPCLAEVVDLLRGEIDGHGIEVRLDLAGPCRTWAVKAQVQQVALNLLTNAIEAVRGKAPGSRRIAIRVTPGPERIDVEFEDSGVGIPPEQVGSLFEPFHTTRHGGLGLGLAISRTLVESHGGRIGVERNAGEGVTFRFSLPALGEEPSAVSAPPKAPGEPDANRPSGPRSGSAPVCVVDDDPAVREGIARLLASAGHAVATFASGEEFLASREREGAACALLDVRMKGLTGPEVHARLASLDPLLPVVFLTGHADVTTGVGAMRQGAVDFLQKPVDEAILLDTVNRAVAAAGAGRARETERRDARERLGRLSPREREILDHVVRGRLNKQIAGDLGIAEATVKQHRGRVMEKMAVRSVADLVRLCELASLPPSYQGRIPGDAAQA